MKAIWIYDIETFKYDWVVVFNNYTTDEYVVIHNDNAEVRRFLSNDPILVGFNSKMFDDYLLKAIIHDASPEIIKDISNFILRKNLPWDHWFIKELPYTELSTADVRSDMYKNLSLKAIEGHLGLPIVESSVPFTLDRPLTTSELEETIEYCQYDVQTTKHIFELRKDYFMTKVRLARLGGVDEVEALGMTNAKVTAAYLGAKKTARSDYRDYKYPPELDISVIPQDILDFFNLVHDQSIPDDRLYEHSLETEVIGVPCVYGWGGVHGTLSQYHAVADEDTFIGIKDVASLYPSLMVEYNYISRNLDSPERFISTRERRMQAKAEGHIDGTTLKLPLNTASGAMENKHNAMYDPRQPLSLRITGQLLMTELVMKIDKVCETFEMLNFNTDGFFFKIDKSEKWLLDLVCEVWENDKRLQLEETVVQQVWIRDVNNLLFVSDTGRITTAGSALSYGISEKGQWAINNSLIIVKQALIDRMTRGVPIRKTIMDCDDPKKFQIIAHAGINYDSVYQETLGGRVNVQKTNRVFASKDLSQGTLYKLKIGKIKGEKIGGLPDHCLIDNKLEVIPDLIDKEWYVELAERQFREYSGGDKWQQTTFLK